MHWFILSAKLFLENIILEYWIIWMFFIVYTEAFIQPIPVDPLIIAASSFLNFKSILFTVFIWTILWSATWYALWKYLWEPIFIKIFWKRSFSAGHKLIEKWWVLWVIIAGLTPIPYKLITWIAWIFEMNFWTFILAWIVWRMPRFILMYYFWEKLAEMF